MLRSRKAAAAVAGLAAAALAVSVSTASAAVDPANPDGAAKEAISAYTAAYPKITPEAAQAAYEQQDARKQLYDQLAKDPSSFGGASFDPPSGVLTIAATTQEAATGAQETGANLGLRVRALLVKRSYDELTSQADQVRRGELGKYVRGNVGVDVLSNQVVAAAPESQLASLQPMADKYGVKLVVNNETAASPDAGCTSRAACDWTIRGGSMLWSGFAGNNVCSVGFTARNSANQRFTYTAGHCSSGAGVTWGTGGQTIGPMGASMDSGPIDASVISVTNPWFTSDLGGELYNQFAAGKTVPVKGVAPTLSFIWTGDVVCLAANFTQPSGNSFCGVVGSVVDPFQRGLVRVNGLDACPGDSGGAWYWLPSSGNRIAYGMHSRSDFGCHGSNGGSHSWFSALPLVKSFLTPALNVETR
jgi:streptogrisin C